MVIEYLHGDVTDKVLKAFYNVYNKLGFGFLEKVCQNALVIELRKFGLDVTSSHVIRVFYDDTEVGFYDADILVNNCVIIEIKECETLCPEHEAQLLNYLKATDIEVGLLLNFGMKPQFKRKVFNNEFKKPRQIKS